MDLSLPRATRAFDGNEWQAHVVTLLGMRYQPGDFYPVPAEEHGDLGMDGVGRDGRVYQCYAPEGEPLDAAVRKRKLKNKISTDLKKLVEKQDEHLEVLGDIIVQRWLLITPKVHSKEIIKHANDEAEKIRKSGCCYISHDFQAIAVTVDDFLGKEKQEYICATLERLKLVVEDADPDQVERFRGDEARSHLVSTLRKKLLKLHTVSHLNIDEIERKHLKRYVEGMALLSALQQNHASVYEQFIKLKRGFEQLIEIRSESSAEPGGKRLAEEMELFKAEAENQLGNVLDSGSISFLVGEAVADWLMRCPLDFPES